MNFSIRLTEYQNNSMLNICDPELLGIDLTENDLQIKITESYYGEKIVSKQEAEDLLRNSSIINMVGEKTVSLSISLGIGSQEGIKKINGIPFLIVFKM